MTFLSVIVTSHGRPVLLKRALDSILRQTFIDYEIIVISDEKNPETAHLCASLLREKDTFVSRGGTPGPAASRNVALTFVKGRYCLFLDDDDSYKENLFDFLFSHTTNQDDIFFWDYNIVNEDREKDNEIKILHTENKIISHIDPGSLMFANFIPNNCISMPSTLARGIQFDTSLKTLEDWDFNLGLLHSSKRFLPLTHIGSSVHKNISPNSQRNEGGRQHWPGDFFYIYRKWSSELEDIKIRRCNILKRYGITISADWL